MSDAEVRDPLGLRSWLRRAPALPFSLYAVFAAFTTYFCMYGFRKPYAVAEYEGQTLGGFDLKYALIISQLLGYALSKYVGIKVCSEITPARRAVTLIGLILVAELALVFVGLAPPALQVVAIFFNGLPLGMIWGLVFSFLEGRRTSDLLGAGLSCSYIVASGAVKSVGKVWLQQGVSESWMPAVTGLTFLLPLLLGVWLLQQLPAPSAADVAARSERTAMDSRMRWGFLGNHLAGMLPLLVLYFFLTAYRDFRDNFSAEIWRDLGYGDQAAVFTVPELYIAFGVMSCLGLIYLVKRNRPAVMAVYGMMIAGVAMVGLATLGFDAGAIGGRAWMTLVGLGLYLAYVPFGCVLFDRLVALLGTPGNAVYAIYLTDALGYTGSVGVNLYKVLGHGDLPELQFFRGFSYLTAGLCLVAFLFSLRAFLRRAPAGSEP